jgi:preprotein translocase subunit SecY
MTAGAMIVLWLSEIINERGVGNGTSLLTYTNIASNLPNLIKKTIFVGDTNPLLIFFSIIGIFLLVSISLYGIVFLQKGVRKIPLRSARQLGQPLLRKTAKDVLYLPLRFNSAGIMPIILTAAILGVPNYIVNSGLFPGLTFLTALKPLYWLSYFISVIVSSLFYSTIVLKPKDLAEQLQKMAVVIPGVRPGAQTIFYLKRVLKRLTLIGALLLATITVIPNFIESTLNITTLNGLGTSSLLILAGVILDLTRDFENIYYSNVYDDRY